MKLILMLFFIFSALSLADEKKELDSIFVNKLNQEALRLVGKDNPKAKILLDSAFNYAYSHISHFWVAKTYQNLGLYEISNDSINKALDYLEVSSRAFADVKFYDESAYSSIILSDLYYSIGRYKKAIEVLKRSEKNIDKVQTTSELYQKVNKKDSAAYYRTKANINSEIFDFKVNIDKNVAEHINVESQIKDLKMELKVEKMKSEFVLWMLLGTIIFLSLILITLAVKLFNTKKELFHLKEKNK
jgi:tetratricopeptide (TPR) repeat protein